MPNSPVSLSLLAILALGARTIGLLFKKEDASVKQSLLDEVRTISDTYWLELTRTCNRQIFLLRL
jgi:hypothetical protein